MWEWMFITVGIGAVVRGQWYYPRTMRRIQVRIAERGRATDKMDALLQSRSYRLVTRTMTGVGIFAIAAGIVFRLAE